MTTAELLKRYPPTESRFFKEITGEWCFFDPFGEAWHCLEGLNADEILVAGAVRVAELDAKSGHKRWGR